MIHQYLIEMQGVTVAFPTKDGGQKVVLKRVDLSLRKGEFMTLVGPSGSGKSVLMKTIFGSLQPTSGRVMVDGEWVQRVNRHQGMVYQKYSLFPHITVAENIGLGMLLENTNLMQRIAHTPHYWRMRKRASLVATEMVQRIGLTASDGHKFPHELSGGMQQRVAIAQALVMRPKVLCMDEAFGALDPMTRKDMQKLVLEIWRQSGLTIIFVTHELEEALTLGSRIIGVTQFWSRDDRLPSEGALIAIDKELPSSPEALASWYRSAEFDALELRIKRDLMQPDFRQPIKDFDLTHPDAKRPVLV